MVTEDLKARVVLWSHQSTVGRTDTRRLVLQVMGAGNVLLSSSLTMTSQQKTFSVALSRDMAPR